MKRMIRNRTPKICFCTLAFLTATVGTIQTARSQTIPIIQMENVPLNDAIRNLAQQTDQNFILDPRLSVPWIGPDGKSGRPPSVNARWENLSAQAALQKLLKEHGLVMVTNAATSIARITYTNQVPASIAPGTTQRGGTNAIIPLIQMDELPLDMAIQNLASHAQLRIVMDNSFPGTSAGPAHPPRPRPTVSVRWKNVTAREALAALLENYDLLLVEDSAAGGAKILPKPQPQPSAPPK